MRGLPHGSDERLSRLGCRARPGPRPSPRCPLRSDARAREALGAPRVAVSTEILRPWTIDADLWVPRSQRFRQYAREPRSPNDAHLSVRDDEDLEWIFTWQEQRKLSKNLTFHYKRATYLVEPGPDTLPLAGERCRVHEHEDGGIEVRHAGQLLPCRLFLDKDPHVWQGAIIVNKRLGAGLDQIQVDQQERDRWRLASPNLALRQKERIRAARASAD